MDAIYARKRRQREKGDEKTLQKQCIELTKSEQENSRFEQMIADVKAKISLVEYGMSNAEKKQECKKKRKREQQAVPTNKTPTTLKSAQGRQVQASNASAESLQRLVQQQQQQQQPAVGGHQPHRRQVSFQEPRAGDESTNVTAILELLNKISGEEKQS